MLTLVPLGSGSQRPASGQHPLTPRGRTERTLLLLAELGAGDGLPDFLSLTVFASSTGI